MLGDRLERLQTAGLLPGQMQPQQEGAVNRRRCRQLHGGAFVVRLACGYCSPGQVDGIRAKWGKQPGVRPAERVRKMLGRRPRVGPRRQNLARAVPVATYSRAEAFSADPKARRKSALPQEVTAKLPLVPRANATLLGPKPIQAAMPSQPSRHSRHHDENEILTERWTYSPCHQPP